MSTDAAETNEINEEVRKVVLDARPILAAGDEPFGAIMEAAATVGVGEILEVIAPFEPVPLQGVLGEQGFTFESHEDPPGNWITTFVRQ